MLNPDRRKVLFFLGASVCLVVFQISLCLSLTPDHFLDSFPRLLYWDGGWYKNIATHGYVSTITSVTSGGKSNVAFFPAYPMLGRLLMKVFSISDKAALLSIAHVCAVLFWFLFFLLLDEIPTSKILKIGVVVFLVFFPTSFYLVAGYTESLFLAASLGCLYFYRRKRPWPSFFCGCFTSATRLVGVALGISILVGDFEQRLWNKLKFKRPWTELLPSDQAILGALSNFVGIALFFLYCYLRFGMWDLYQETGRRGWAARPTWDGFYSAALWIPSFYGSFSQWLDLASNQMSRLYTTVTAWLIVATVVFHVRQRLRAKFLVSSFASMLILYAVGLFAISVIHSFNRDMFSMVRYVFPVVIFLLLAVLHELTLGAGKKTVYALASALLLACIPNAYYLILNIKRFVRFIWVA